MLRMLVVTQHFTGCARAAHSLQERWSKRSRCSSSLAQAETLRTMPATPRYILRHAVWRAQLSCPYCRTSIHSRMLAMQKLLPTLLLSWTISHLLRRGRSCNSLLVNERHRRLFAEVAVSGSVDRKGKGALIYPGIVDLSVRASKLLDGGQTRTKWTRSLPSG